jgi:hypothetical protein
LEHTTEFEGCDRLAFAQAGGVRFSIGGELGGIGSGDYTMWSVRATASVQF